MNKKILLFLAIIMLISCKSSTKHDESKFSSSNLSETITSNDITESNSENNSSSFNSYYSVELPWI